MGQVAQTPGGMIVADLNQVGVGIDDEDGIACILKKVDVIEFDIVDLPAQAGDFAAGGVKLSLKLFDVCLVLYLFHWLGSPWASS